MSQNSSLEQNTKTVKEIAASLGFMYCGVSEAGFLEEEAPRFEAWLAKGNQGSMGYLERNFDKRLDPRLLVDNAKSVVTLLYNYFPKEEIDQENNYKLARYAYGEDYHFVIKDKLKLFFELLGQKIGDIGGRGFVDSAPVHERAWAAKAGAGWVGKNTLLLNRNHGSYFFLAELIIDLPLIADGPIKDYCGTCTACVDACPTDAITPYSVDANKCISYLTIELKDQIPQEFQDKMADWMFGCDICQEVCPWNRFATAHAEPAFQPNTDLIKFKKSDWEDLSAEVFSKTFKKSAVKRAKYSGLQRNIEFLKAKGNKKNH
jgi:epoxyqueuosine reductase